MESLADELARLEAQAAGAEGSEDGKKLSASVAIAEAVSKAREALKAAEEKNEAALSVVAALNAAGQVAPSLMAIAEQLHKTDGQLSAVALAFKEGTESQQKAFFDVLKGQTKEMHQAVKIVAECHASAAKQAGSEQAEALQAVGLAITNLLQELEDGLKVEIEDRDAVPVVAYGQGAIAGVDRAVPVFIVDRDGKPAKQGGAAAAVGHYGPRVSNDPLAEYKISDTSTAESTSYSGYLAIDGRWYVSRAAAGATRYASGKGGYAEAWEGRAALTYSYLNEAF